MQALLVENMDGTPRMVPGEYKTPEPADHELLVKIEATALNRADLLQKSGRYPPPEGASSLLGLEMAGVVEKAGADAGWFSPGDAVFGLLPSGGYAEYCVLPESHVIRKPDSLSFEEAAAIPEAFLTAWQALVWLGNLRKGETVLIHAGGSGVGSAAIQLARQMFDARIITTAGKDDKLETCSRLGADLTINYNRDSFDEVIAHHFGESAVDLIIEFIGEPYWEKNIRSLAMDGRLIYLAMMGGARISEMSLTPILRKRLTIRGSLLRNRSQEYKSELIRDFSSQAMDLLMEGKLKPVIDSIYDWKDVEEAHRRMAGNLNTGKIVLTGM